MIDPLENNLFDLPDYENTEDETFPPLPPPTSPGKDDAEWALANGETDGNQQSQTKDSSATTRKAVKRPIPKLDAQRLVSERGLPALRHIFDNTKFKGKGHEAEDLKTLIRHMEHWAHRLFPKLQFDDFIDRVESLGNKKEVQTCLKRIRLDLPILHEDFTNNEDGGGESNGLDIATEDTRSCSGNLREELDSPSGTTLTAEQQQRIKKNRQLALERRQAKMQCNSQSQQSELSASYPEEEVFKTTAAQNLADLTEDTHVTATKFAVADAEDRGTELEYASKKQ
ncbi:TIMELESS-interacting protein isoform X1 [Struthio camelus]|nr:PREDICTED: TIMELESS-interacting protein isoform X1 [Struthio camelus australis]XP_009679456.1 PREDICTED: TIMELESS-interacting protein isoform X1 [Struthio camelus australis]XP_009679457.1 PREDICTED: TIMELESS-interacting protein isoform X1 [Struthio camelus australis]